LENLSKHYWEINRKKTLVGAIGEVIEESAVEFGNQANDMLQVFVQNLIFRLKCRFVTTGMGGIQTIGVYRPKDM
jgi:hypothetical protein